MTAISPRRRNLRLTGYDYSQPGVYFVTICILGRACLLGTMGESRMRLNELGSIITSCWHDLPSRYPHVSLDAFVVMPNHIHGIISAGAGLPRLSPGPTLGNILGYFKYQSTKRINEFRKTPGAQLWQRNFFEHIIRDDNSLNRIREYITFNPQRWHLDRENPKAAGQDEFDLWLKNRKKGSLRKRQDSAVKPSPDDTLMKNGRNLD